MRPAKKARDIQRSVHLVASAMLLGYLYTPLGDNPLFDVMLRAMVIPVVAVSRILMWQWPRIRRHIRRRGGRSGLKPRGGNLPARALRSSEESLLATTPAQPGLRGLGRARL